MRSAIPITIILISTLLITLNITSISCQQPPIISEISGENIQLIVNDLTSFQTRRAGTVECNISAEYIYTYLSSINVSASYEYFTTPTGVLINVIGDIPGLDQRGRYVVIGAHYDSISHSGNAPGAVDNAAAIAVIMEIARVLSNHSLPRSVKLLFFSGEEIGRYGSLNWVNKHSDMRANLTATLILDMIAYGDSLIVDYNSLSKPLADYIFEKTSFKNYMSIEENSYLSDHQSFWSASIPTVLIHQNNPLDYPYYHTSEDTVDKVNFNLVFLTAQFTLEAVYFLATDPDVENIYYKANLIYPIIIIVLPIVSLTGLGLIIKFKFSRREIENCSNHRRL
ncbi:MAG: DUF4910 domain-containing protein [Candidatus Odinarchaeum yellowstonii]|uniref:DUF4910 domain-containing protein n=1 Tax=Odinarchaeota yellowstonii (strain LCB_4) TaxID=1841599 RepID=A0AAF0IBK6_ODILC|nr:MAG: DUF4910 domain-containing protein [Candidatus Odinarchaeum yellowstonii]